MGTVVGVDPGLNHVGLAGINSHTGKLIKAELLRVRNPGARKYVDATEQTIFALLDGRWQDLGPLSVYVERPGIHGIRKRGHAIAGTKTAGGVTRNWVVIEDLLSMSERLQQALGAEPAFVIGRKGAADWRLRSWCGRESKETRHLKLTLETEPAEQALAKQAAPPYLRHNVLDAWCIARWAWRHS